MYRYPHSSSNFGYGGAAWSKDALSDERDGSLLLMPAGMFFVVGGCSRGGLSSLSSDKAFIERAAPYVNDGANILNNKIP